MRKLEIVENAVLSLKQVIVVEIRGCSIESLDRELVAIELRLEQLGIEILGPMVLRSCGSFIDDRGRLTVDQDVLIETENPKRFNDQFKIVETYQVSPCLYLRYIGNPEMVHFATNKLELFLYENYLEDSGELYTVLMRDQRDTLVIDYYKPLV